MRRLCIFDGKIVKMKLPLHDAQDVGVGLVQSHPDELVRRLERYSGPLERKRSYPPAHGIRGTIDDSGRFTH